MSASLSGTVAIPVLDYLGGLGVNTHISYTDGEYVSLALDISDLKYLGLDQIRDSISDGYAGSAPLSSYIAIAQAGMAFTFLVGGSDNADIESQLALINAVERAVPGSIIAIEGPNEINNFPVTFNGTSGQAGALDMQEAIHADVAADPTLAGVSVDYFTGYDGGPDPVAASLATYDNQHPYPYYDAPPAAAVARTIALGNTTNASEPAVFTETGYSSNNTNTDVQAVYSLDLLMDTAQEGIAKTYLYDLLDAYAPGSPQGDDGFGLFSYTEAPKPVAVDIHNLTSILRADASNHANNTISPHGTLAYNLQDLPPTGESLLLQEPDGEFILAVWAEPEIWDTTTSSEIPAPSFAVTLTLEGDSSGYSRVFDPTLGTAAIAKYGPGNRLTFAVSDHPVLVALTANVPCFARGTHILTPRGDVPVEALRAGDFVITHHGEEAEIVWIGQREINLRRHPSPAQAQPVRIAAGAFGPGLPARDLLLSPDHALYVEGALIPVKALINHTSICQLNRPTVTYYHIELARHAVIFAEQLPVESYLETGNRGAFENGGGVITLHPDFAQTRREQCSCAPFMETGRLVEQTRARLAWEGYLASTTRSARP